MIESGFKVSARSKAQAVGMWQFIKPTAERYGLAVNRYIDERRDPIRATIAATEYLNDLYNVFGSWPLALSAYNAGESRIMNLIMRYGTRDYWVLSKKPKFPKETANYVPKLLAAAILASSPEKFGFRKATPASIPRLHRLRFALRCDSAQSLVPVEAPLMSSSV